MGSVFISYRREDTDGQARALFQDLIARLGRDAVFMDVDSIALGRDFRTVLQERLASCDVMLALIGRDWLDGKDKSGRRRLDNAGDFVRLEIATALKRNIPVTPVLLHGAPMPAADQLPEDLADLAYRNGFELSHSRWESDVQELIRRLGLSAPPDPAAQGNTRSVSAGPSKHSKSWIALAGVIAAVIAVTLVAPRFNKKDGPEQSRGIASGTSASDGEAAGAKIRAEGEPVADSSKFGGKPPSATAYLDAPAAANAAIGRRASEHTQALASSEFQLSISSEGRYASTPFTVPLDPTRDFAIDFKIKSTRDGGSTRYGIAWNYVPEDFMLFTIHSMNAQYYSIGPGRSSTYAPFSRMSEGQVSMHGESDFDTLQIRKKGAELTFAINGNDVWRTSQTLTTNHFAFWVADYSDAVLASYTVRQ